MEICLIILAERGFGTMFGFSGDTDSALGSTGTAICPKVLLHFDCPGKTLF